MNNILRSAVAAITICSIFAMVTAKPAKADTTSTLLIGAAAVAGVATAINVENKDAQANDLIGYLPNGDEYFADGHALTPDGQVYYPGNDGESVQCDGQNCYIVSDNTGPAYYGPAYYGSGYYAPVPAYGVGIVVGGNGGYYRNSYRGNDYRGGQNVNVNRNTGGNRNTGRGQAPRGGGGRNTGSGHGRPPR